ncbi:hypothetical protein [Sphingobacterium sp. 1.A.5]|uniref:hypothetical protein n=1 Tax=Sphingobacterium sp. 1.A.5 TaxID=2044604 RepID=UPI0011819119|nr:hypothetical protein [Sphingobacterium sp. 1.A.5]
MMRFIYILCFTFLAMVSPKLGLACSEHQEQPAETSCHKEHHSEDPHSCCNEDFKDQSHDGNDSCGESSNCNCPMMANHSCCFFSTSFFEFKFSAVHPKDEISTLMVFHETTGFSSIFIPPKIV